MSSIWPYLLEVCFLSHVACIHSCSLHLQHKLLRYLIQVDDENSSAKFLGWVIAAFSFGQLIGSPFFGFWGDKRPTREPLIVALLIMVLFNIVYSYCGAFKSGLAGWIMLVSRAMVGFGAGKCLSSILSTASCDTF